MYILVGAEVLDMKVSHAFICLVSFILYEVSCE